MKKLIFALLILASPAFAQWQVPAGNVPVGQGPGFTGFAAVAPGTSGNCLVSSGATWISGACPSTSSKISSPKTANYTIAATDIETTVTFGTGSTSQITATLPTLPSAGFTAGAIIRIKNNNVYSGIGTGHAVTLSGFPTDLYSLLWPQQALSVQVNAAGTAWVTIQNPGPWILPTSAEICVTQNGNDANDGLGAGTGCMASIQNAILRIGSQWNGGGYNGCAVGLYSGGTNIFNEAVAQTGQSLGCYLTYNTRGNVTWQSTTYCLSIGDNAIAIVNWTSAVLTLKCNTGNNASVGAFVCHQTCIYDLNGGTVIWLPGGSNDTFLYVDLQGSATINTTVNIGDGTNTYSFLTFIYCVSHCSKITTSGSVGFNAHVTGTLALALSSGSVITTTMSWPGAPGGFSPTTPTGNSILITNGTTIPGGTASATGGQVCATAC